MSIVYFSIGGNLGDREKNLAMCMHMLDLSIGSKLKLSSLYETKAWGNAHQPDFLNLVAKYNTNLAAEDVLKKTIEIEDKLGRERKERWGSRTIDIDILFFNLDIIYTNNLIVPHPLMHKRKFVLIPLLEIEPELIHPKLNLSVKELVTACGDELEIKKYNPN